MWALTPFLSCSPQCEGIPTSQVRLLSLNSLKCKTQFLHHTNHMSITQQLHRVNGDSIGQHRERERFHHGIWSYGTAPRAGVLPWSGALKMDGIF